VKEGVRRRTGGGKGGWMMGKHSCREEARVGREEEGKAAVQVNRCAVHMGQA